MTTSSRLGADVPPVRLPCGQLVEDLYARVQAHQPLGAHSQQCRCCRDTAAGMTALAWATTLLRAETPPSTASLLDGALDVIRTITDRR